MVSCEISLRLGIVRRRVKGSEAHPRETHLNRGGVVALRRPAPRAAARLLLDRTRAYKGNVPALHGPVVIAARRPYLKAGQRLHNHALRPGTGRAPSGAMPDM